MPAQTTTLPPRQYFSTAVMQHPHIGAKGSSPRLQNTLKCVSGRGSAWTPLCELTTLPRSPGRLGRRHPSPYLTSLGVSPVFGARHSELSEPRFGDIATPIFSSRTAPSLHTTLDHESLSLLQVYYSTNTGTDQVIDLFSRKHCCRLTLVGILNSD